MKFEKDDLKKSKKQILEEFEKYRVENGDLLTLVEIMNTKFRGRFQNYYSDNVEVRTYDHIVPTGSNEHKLPLNFRGRAGRLQLIIPHKSVCGSYLDPEYYHLTTGWYYLVDFPRQKIQDASKAVLTKFCKYITDWQNAYGNKEKADNLWVEFEQFCVDKLGAKIVHE